MTEDDLEIERLKAGPVGPDGPFIAVCIVGGIVGGIVLFTVGKLFGLLV